MRRVVVVGAALLAAVGAAVAFGACTSGARMPHGGSPGTGPASADVRPTPPIDGSSAATAMPASAGAATPDTSALAPSPAPEPGDADAPSPSCTAPTVDLEKPPVGSIVFNNAMTAADAGYLDRTAGVVATMAEHHAQLGCCLESWSRGRTAGGAELVVSLTIEPDGAVREASIPVGRGSVVDAATAECLLGVVRSVRFPRSPAGRITVADYPLRLATSR